MHTQWRHSLEETVRAVTIHSLTCYSWFGHRSLYLPKTVCSALNSEQARQYLLNALTSRLYGDFYLTGSPALSKPEAANPFDIAITPFVAELSAANCGSGYWEQGWKVRTLANGTIGVFRGDLTIWVRREDCLVARAGTIVPDAAVCVRFPKEFLGMSPGFYMALGNNPLPADAGQVLIRVYWNLCSEGAIPFVKLGCQLLNETPFPFRLKVLNDPTRFRRCDAGVIYAMKRDYPALAQALSMVYRDVAKYLGPETPAFTKPLALGVGLAENPGGESFGRHRCRLLADAIIRAYEEGKRTVKGRVNVITDYFDSHGIELSRPYLNPGSTDEYESFFRFPKGEATYVSKKDWKLGMFLDTADELGWRLSKQAVWYRKQCNWLGAEPLSRFQEDGFESMYKPLGPTLYSGTSGVALFLAELYASSGSREARRTAVGAMQQALGHLPQECLGLYTGILGVVYAAARVGLVLGEQELLERARHLIERCSNEGKTPIEFDLLSGCAGAVVAVLLLREMLQDEILLEIAVRFADKLLQSAEDSDAGCSWRSPTLHYRHNLTGLSHGTAGVAYALLELFHVTADTKYRTVAERAFEYERHWFDAEKGNWPDFRHDRNDKRQRQSPRFVTFWCHGAPGIGLARLRAYEILGDERCKEEGIIALNTTHAALQMERSPSAENFSLCHGLAGNAELLLYGRQVLGPKWTDKAALAFEIARNGIILSRERGGFWRGGINRGETPALMLGLAGIGYFYLRLHEPQIPSILLLRSKDGRTQNDSRPQEGDRHASSVWPRTRRGLDGKIDPG